MSLFTANMADPATVEFIPAVVAVADHEDNSTSLQLLVSTVNLKSWTARKQHSSGQSRVPSGVSRHFVE